MWNTGAWIDADGVQKPPLFFPRYLSLALALGPLLPVLVLLGTAANALSTTARGPTRASTPPWSSPAVLYCLPFLLLFLAQTGLETKWMRHSLMAPTVPLLFMMYRLWQLLRSCWLMQQIPQSAAAARLCELLLVAQLLFWCFDTAAGLNPEELKPNP